MECESIARPHFHFGGLLGQRIDANEANWLLRAPHDNPGLLDMFRVRDQKPEPDLVPLGGRVCRQISAVRDSSFAHVRQSPTANSDKADCG